MKYFELYSAYKIYMDLTTPLSNEFDCCYIAASPACHDPHYLMNYSWADRFIRARHTHTHTHNLPSQITRSRGNASPGRQRGRELSPRWCCRTHTHTHTHRRRERERES